MQQDLPVGFTAVALLNPCTQTLVDQPCRHRCAAINAKKSLKLYFDQSDPAKGDKLKGNMSYDIKRAINTQHILLVDSYLIRITCRRRKLLPLVFPRALLEVTYYTRS